MSLFKHLFFFSTVIALSFLGGGVVFAQTPPAPAAPPSGGVNLGGGYTLGGTPGNTTDTGWVFGPGVNNGGGGTTNTGGAAQGLNFVPLVKDYPQLGRMQNPDIPSFLNTLFAITIAVAATLAVIMVAIGGIEYMLTESPFKMGDAKDRIWSAIFGLLIVLTSVLLLRTINPQIVSLQLFRPSAPTVTPTRTAPVQTAAEVARQQNIAKCLAQQNILKRNAVGHCYQPNQTPQEIAQCEKDAGIYSNAASGCAAQYP